MLLETQAVVVLRSVVLQLQHTHHSLHLENARSLNQTRPHCWFTPFVLLCAICPQHAHAQFSASLLLIQLLYFVLSIIWFGILYLNCRDQKWQAPRAEAVQVAATEVQGAQAQPTLLEHQLCTHTKNWKPSRADYITEEQNLCRHPRGAVSHVWIPPAPRAKRLKAQYSLCHTPPTHSPSPGLRATDTIFIEKFVRQTT